VRGLPAGVSCTLLDAGRGHILGVRTEHLHSDAAADGAPVEMLPVGMYHDPLASSSGGGGGSGDAADDLMIEPHAGSVWQLVSPSTVGGASTGLSTGSLYRLRHVATRRFLRAMPLDAGGGVGGGQVSAYDLDATLQLRLTLNPLAEGTLFRFDRPPRRQLARGGAPAQRARGTGATVGVGGGGGGGQGGGRGGGGGGGGGRRGGGGGGGAGGAHAGPAAGLDWPRAQGN
jgi:hypothetical protein